MAKRAERVRSLVQRHGEEVVVNGTRTVRMVVFVATSGLLRTFFTDEDLLNYNRPIWAGVMAAEEALNPGDSITRDGVTHTVRRVAVLKIGNAPAVKLAVWSQ
jgi:hypothetical protein